MAKKILQCRNPFRENAYLYAIGTEGACDFIKADTAPTPGNAAGRIEDVDAGIPEDLRPAQDGAEGVGAATD